MAVLEPLLLKIINYAELGLPIGTHTINVKQFPTDPNCVEEWTIAFSDSIYIEQSDFRQVNFLVALHYFIQILDRR